MLGKMQLCPMTRGRAALFRLIYHAYEIFLIRCRPACPAPHGVGTPPKAHRDSLQTSSLSPPLIAISRHASPWSRGSYQHRHHECFYYGDRSDHNGAGHPDSTTGADGCGHATMWRTLFYDSWRRRVELLPPKLGSVSDRGILLARYLPRRIHSCLHCVR